MSNEIVSIREKATKYDKVDTVMYAFNEYNLKLAALGLKGNKAVGIDQVTKKEYLSNINENIRNLIQRMKRMAYKPKAVRRVYIPKPGSDKKRPLGIPAIEDKVVQKVMADILNVIYEPMFKEFSYGFRPDRNCHQALAYLNHMIIKENTNYIVDLDIKGYFDNINHEWLMKFIEYRIADKVFCRYVRRFLKSGILEQGKLIKLETGTPQGGIVSPILGNIYLHFVLDDWFEKIVVKGSKGYAGMVRYADDSVACFEYKEDAEKYLRSVKKRLQKFGLEVSEEKTKIIEFGRQPYLRQQYYGNKKLGTFDFLGFTHCCGRGRNGKFKVRRLTSKKKLNAKAKEIKKWLKKQNA